MGAKPVDPRKHELSYMQVARDITLRIEVGEFTHQLPGERNLATEYGCAYQTVRRAMEILRERGLIITRQGRGTFVALDGEAEPG